MPREETFHLTLDEVAKTLKRRLLDGWVVVTGDVEAIGRLEKTFFTPGKPENADFELLVLSSPSGVGVRYLFLAKKQRLKALNIVGLERTLELNYAGFDGRLSNVQQIVAKSCEPEQVDVYVRTLLARFSRPSQGGMC
jgi:hypothetical protein